MRRAGILGHVGNYSKLGEPLKIVSRGIACNESFEASGRAAGQEKITICRDVKKDWRPAD
ncbi:hypothetical protein NED98_10750 [Sphingomonas sp. MMSM20]|uniref:hypothetical protein n=1 Tax=Sphingomonas lycopersici TaxID=2951807 RepID=UPI00223894E0|nr:hypothetical protein [Sphingomonas lycopersici]MCW6530723.1 hypothetical protein [Sphingomonas lycopersici]